MSLHSLPQRAWAAIIAALSAGARHSTFGLESRSLHEPLPVHVTTHTSPKRECRAAFDDPKQAEPRIGAVGAFSEGPAILELSDFVLHHSFKDDLSIKWLVRIEELWSRNRMTAAGDEHLLQFRPHTVSAGRWRPPGAPATTPPARR